MRRSLARGLAAAKGDLVKRREAQTSLSSSNEKNSKLQNLKTGISSDLQSAASAVNRGVFKGSGTAYAPGSPILSQVLSSPAAGGDKPAPIVTTTGPAKQTTQRSRTLMELKELSVKELQQILEERGVGHSSRDKDDLVSWVHQHQDLPVKAAADSAPAPQSLQELKQMSVKELKEMLASRGVAEGSATEKSDLVTWVWQHQHLPVLSDWQSRKRGRKRFGFGPGGEGMESESPEKEPELEKIEANDAKQIAGDETKLLEGTTSESEQPRWRFGTLLFASIGVLAVLVAAVAANDALQAGDEDTSKSIQR